MSISIPFGQRCDVCGKPATRSAPRQPKPGVIATNDLCFLCDMHAPPLTTGAIHAKRAAQALSEAEARAPAERGPCDECGAPAKWYGSLPPPLDIVMAQPPGPTSDFVETERAGRGVGVGEWIQREDGFWALRIHIGLVAGERGGGLEVPWRSCPIHVPKLASWKEYMR